RSGELRLPEYGESAATVELSPAQPTRARLTCNVRAMEVQRAERPDGEHAKERVSLLGCRVEPRLEPLNLEALALGRAAGIAIHRSQWTPDYEEPVLVRVATGPSR